MRISWAFVLTVYQLRITTQLVEVPSGTLIWSHSSQATTRELLELHDDLVRRAVESILPSMKLDSAAVLDGDSDAAGFADHIPEVFSQSAHNEENAVRCESG